MSCLNPFCLSRIRPGPVIIGLPPARAYRLSLANAEAMADGGAGLSLRRAGGA